MAFSQPPRQKYLTAGFINNRTNARAPFLVDRRIFLESEAGTSVYGVKHPGNTDTTQYSRFEQETTGNKAFTLPSTSDAPLQTTGGAVTAANQLRTLVLLNGTPIPHTRDDQVAAADSYCIGAGGGTAIGEAVIVDGVNEVGAIVLNVKRADAGTETILVGDIITIAGDDTEYRCTETSQALNGTTGVAVSITPPLVVETAGDEEVTIATSDDRTILFATAPTVGDIIEVLVFASGDITTLTGGALTAGRIYEETCYDYMYSAGNCNVTAAVG